METDLVNKKRSKVAVFGEIDRGNDGSIYGEIDRTSDNGELHIIIRKLPGKTAYIRVELEGDVIINGYMADVKTQTIIFKNRRNPIVVKGTEND